MDSSPLRMTHWSGSSLLETLMIPAIQSSLLKWVRWPWGRQHTSECCVTLRRSLPRLDHPGHTCSQPAWIFSGRTYPAIKGANLRFVQGDVRQFHDQMRVAAGSKNIWIVGGGDLAGQFYDAGLLDELIVQIGSATLGKGKPLFPRRVLSPRLRLVSVRQIGSGMAELRYEVCRVGKGSA